MTEDDIKERLAEIRSKLMIMEWDKAKNQLNAGKLTLFKELQEEKQKLETQLTSSATEEKQNGI